MDLLHRGRWVGFSLLVALVAGCDFAEVVGSGNVVQEERTTSDFVALDVSDGLSALVQVDPTKPRSVIVSGDDNLVAFVRTDNDGRTLRVSFRNEGVHGGWSSHHPLRVEVTVPALDGFECSGGCLAELGGTLTSSSFALNTSGGAKVKATGLAVGELTLGVSGGGETLLEGQATRLTSDISGGSELKGRGFATRHASLDSSGGGTLVLQVSDTLSVNASGGSTLRIIGRPDVVSKDLSGGSSLDFE